jgi:hypothetical protein
MFFRGSSEHGLDLHEPRAHNHNVVPKTSNTSKILLWKSLTIGAARGQGMGRRYAHGGGAGMLSSGRWTACTGRPC